jgi:hypothetical protein
MRAYPLHGVERAHHAAVPGGERGPHGGLDLRHERPQRVGAERALHELADAEVVVALVEEERRRPDHALLAPRVRRLEQVRLRHQHEPRRLRACQHHARAPEKVRLEDLAVPAAHKSHAVRRRQ